MNIGDPGHARHLEFSHGGHYAIGLPLIQHDAFSDVYDCCLLAAPDVNRSIMKCSLLIYVYHECPDYAIALFEVMGYVASRVSAIGPCSWDVAHSVVYPRVGRLVSIPLPHIAVADFLEKVVARLLLLLIELCAELACAPTSCICAGLFSTQRLV